MFITACNERRNSHPNQTLSIRHTFIHKKEVPARPYQKLHGAIVSGRSLRLPLYLPLTVNIVFFLYGYMLSELNNKLCEAKCTQ